MDTQAMIEDIAAYDERMGRVLQRGVRAGRITSVSEDEDHAILIAFHPDLSAAAALSQLTLIIHKSRPTYVSMAMYAPAMNLTVRLEWT